MKKIVMGILAHVDAGKTTLSEGMLFVSGKIKKLGRVDHRDTYLDTHTLERTRGITIFSKQAILQTGGLELILLDTPGHADFSGEMERTLQVLDYAVLVISGTDGVQAHTQTLWTLLEHYHIPTFLFITKMDVANHSPEEIMTDLQEHLSENCLDFSRPLGTVGKEAIAMLDEKLLDLYMDTGLITDSDIALLIQDRQLFPCCFGSGLRLDGVEEFLHILERYTIQPSYSPVFGAKVYKIARDRQGNRLTYLKVTGGELSVRSAVRYLPSRGSEPVEEKISQLRIYSGQKYETAEIVPAGSICAATGLTGTYTGQGLGAEPDSEGVTLEPAMGYRIVLPKDCDARTMLPKLRQLEEEDPLLHILWQPALNEIHIQLMGSVQTDVIKSLIRERFDVDVQIEAGRILYRETVTNTVEGVGHFEPLKHYAEVHLLIEPGERGSGIILDTACSRDTLDVNWQRLILSHLEEKQHVGVLTGSPLTDVKITLLAGRAHPKHTEGGDFRQATYRAVRQGLMKAESILLEPYFAFRLEVPSGQIGRAISDIQAMYGKYDIPVTSGEFTVLTGRAPVISMTDYSAEVAAYTHGRGRLSCHMDGFLPCHNAQAVIEKMAYDPEADVENTPDSVFCAHGAGFNVRWNETENYMHLSSSLPHGEQSEDTVPRLHVRNLDLDEKELESILEREFGPIRRKSYATPVIHDAGDGQTQTRKKGEHVIVDGYNVIFAWDELSNLADKSLDLARDRLIGMLVNYRNFTKADIILVFDAYLVPGGRGEKYDDCGLRIAYTKEGETADMYIERLANSIGKNESVRVITSDNLIRLTALRAGVLRTSSLEFQREVHWTLKQIEQIISKTQES